MSNSAQHTSSDDVVPSDTVDGDAAILEVLQTLQTSSNNHALTQHEVNARVTTARAVIAYLNSSPFLASTDHYDEQLSIIAEIQNIAYHDTDQGGVQDIAQWCLRAYLQILSHGPENAPEVLAGLGQGWLLRAQQTLARIHRQEGSSSSGTSSGVGGGTGGRVNSFTSSEDAREAARQNIESDARAGSADYVEARGMLLPATEYFQRAVEATERAGRVEGPLLSLAAEAFISLGNVSYSHHNEQYFQHAVRYLQMASQVPAYRLSPYLQSYLDDFGRLVN